MDSVTQESFSLGTLRFREEHLPCRDNFDLPQFSDYVLHAAPCGGALAFSKNPHSHLIMGFDSSLLEFYNAYGRKISSMNVKNWKDVKKMGWTLSEHFVVVFGEVVTGFSGDTSKIEIYTIMQEHFHSYSLPNVCISGETHSVISFYIYSS